MTRIVLAGECDKHDFVLMMASLLHAHTGKEAYIVTDKEERYRYFQENIPGVTVTGTGLPEDAEVALYDWHNRLPDDIGEAKLVFASDYSRGSLENLDLLMDDQAPDKVLIIEEECNIGLRYMEKRYPTASLIIDYMSSPERKIEWSHQGTISYKVDKDFAAAINECLVDQADVPRADIKKLWQFARKRG
ncbi:hypothetical protein [Paenibacillus herberti]|uniref:Uncharacterized protein n=1 Tax=Paenibacillus herberti TaxID=1619309 RepID=A0A229NZV5_9BACL|nr:hypothetical protein [Paenibacillus herberti]OXM15543.1 hypothetical protein CGZ75_02050 [Paenibacillus herberti]